MCTPHNDIIPNITKWWGCNAIGTLMRTNSHQQSGINKECKHIDKEVKHDRRNNMSVSTTAAAAADGPGGVCVLAHPSPPHAPPLPTTHALGGERPA